MEKTNNINLPDSNKLVFTIGVTEFLDALKKTVKCPNCEMKNKVKEEYKKQPDEDLQGGNDKSFFSFTFHGMKFWAVANELGGLTIMYPNEY